MQDGGVTGLAEGVLDDWIGIPRGVNRQILPVPLPHLVSQPHR